MSVQIIILLINNKENKKEEKSATESMDTSMESMEKSKASFSKLQMWTVHHLQNVYTQDTRKIPTVKGSGCFCSNVWNLHQLKIRYLLLNLLSLNQIPL